MKVVVKLLKRLVPSILMIVQLVSLDASAMGVSCHKSQGYGHFLPIDSLGRSLKRTLKPEEIINDSNEKIGGLVQLSELPISKEHKKSLMELVRMVAYASKVDIKHVENMKGKIEQILLGIPLTDGFSIDLIYKLKDRKVIGADGEAIYQDRVTIDEGWLIDPAGIPKRMFGSSILAGNEVGQPLKLNPLVMPVLQDYPALARYNFKVAIPTAIESAVMERFAPIAEKLSLMDKKEITPIAEKQQYYKMRWELNKRYITNRLTHYLKDKGVFKQPPKILAKILGISLVVGGVLAASHAAPDSFDGAVSWGRQKISVQADIWSINTIRQFANKPNLPAEVKSQLSNLEADIHAKINSQDFICNYKCKYPANPNAVKKEIASNKYLWFDVKEDPDTKKPITVVYILKVIESSGEMTVVAAPVEAAKYKTLMDYLDNRGQFYFDPVAERTP